MREQYNEDLKKLNDMLVEMGNLVEISLEKSKKAFKEQDKTLAEDIVRGDQSINNLEHDIEALCFKLIEMSLSFNGKYPYKTVEHIPTMMKVCREMVHEAIRAYVTKDLERGKRADAMDDQVDVLFSEVKAEIVEILKEGTGNKPSATDKVRCHYEGTLLDGTLFDSSYKRGEPAVFGLNQVIPGWTEALQLMAEGAKYRIFLPHELAYGAQGAGEMIPPYSALIFTVELLEVLK